jgi:hypothetical protein
VQLAATESWYSNRKEEANHTDLLPLRRRFRKGGWEEILQEPVEIELLESVLKGDEVCKVAIHLPRADSGRGD